MAKAAPQCRACGAPVIWARSVNGKSVMLDRQRDLSGSSRHAVMRDTGLRVHVRVLAIGEQPKAGVEHLHQPHYATCPAQRKGPDDD